MASITNKKKKVITVLAGILAFGIVIFVIQFFVFKDSRRESELKQAAADLNKTCPVMINKTTRLDNSVLLPGNVFQYNYTLVGMVKSEIDLNHMQRVLEPSIVYNVKTHPGMEMFRGNNTTVSYNYKDRNGIFLLRISVTPDKYLD